MIEKQHRWWPRLRISTILWLMVVVAVFFGGRHSMQKTMTIENEIVHRHLRMIRRENEEVRQVYQQEIAILRKKIEVLQQRTVMRPLREVRSVQS